jgi:hydrogenase maturation factor HypF (carbamoyltransferase family)
MHVHDRPIVRPVHDSVVRFVRERELVLQRAPSAFLVLFVWKEFATHNDSDSLASGVWLPSDVHLKIDCAHDAVSELLMN